jgi:hypothetical protein
MRAAAKQAATHIVRLKNSITNPGLSAFLSPFSVFSVLKLLALAVRKGFNTENTEEKMRNPEKL